MELVGSGVTTGASILGSTGAETAGMGGRSRGGTLSGSADIGGLTGSATVGGVGGACGAGAVVVGETDWGVGRGGRSSGGGVSGGGVGVVTSVTCGSATCSMVGCWAAPPSLAIVSSASFILRSVAFWKISNSLMIVG